MTASRAEFGMNGDATGAVEQCGGIAAMDHPKRIVGAAIGRADEHRMPALDLGELHAELLDHRRPAPALDHGAYLLKAVESLVVRAVHGACRCS